MSNYKKATLGGGCFWCVEAIMLRLKGVISAESGYAGGRTENPSYQDVCSGVTGHAEVVQVTFDPEVISYGDIVEVFFHTHDPTTMNRQGADVGTQYRSVIFYHDQEQKEIAEAKKEEVDGSDLWSDPIVTEISPLDKFYPAENYHRNYFDTNPYQPYCMAVVSPKVQKFMKTFREKVKVEAL
ncbi:MAG: peptide-methionine (S)-S-oxide reductase MsrA [Ignavibacteriae bacterium]|nr:peptide-methionine (S)-S-oxide reductase MsrA [Ignavibacteriota bacterium]MCB9216456.1 peptide-methionine (S)-S-oxide reductase MsrA [Ignavibacteria bacterium]